MALPASNRGYNSGVSGDAAIYTPSGPSASPSSEARWKTYGCLALLLIGLHLVVGPKILLSQWRVTPDGNTGLEEALQWRKGSLALSHRFYESSESGGRYYNAIGPAFTFLALAATSLDDLLAAPAGTEASASAPAGLSSALYVTLVALPLPFVAFWAFRGIVRTSPWAAVLAAALIAGTSLTPVLATCREGSIYYINHVLATVGLLVFAAELLGRRRLWLAAIGLCLAAWSRQMTVLYALPLLWLAWSRTGAGAGGSSLGRRRRMIVAAGGVFVAIAVPLTLNTLKFGSPFDTGYGRLYEGRTDQIGRRAQEALFDLRYVPMQARAMNLAYPAWDIRAGTFHADISGIDGGSIWLTSPLLLGAIVTIRRWWSDPARRALMLGTLPVIAGLMCYHTTGADRAGYYRYSLDFIPVWLLVIAPYTSGRRGVPLTLACLAYSALYFNILP